MSKTATKEKNSSGLSQDDIRRAAKKRRKNAPKKAVTPLFSIREAKKEQRERRLAIAEQKRQGILVNECIDAVFAGADRIGLCFLYPVEKEQRDVNDTVIPPRFDVEVRAKAQQEIADWCDKNPGKYECKLKYNSKTDTTELALANLMFIKKG